MQYLSYGYDADDNITGITDNVTPADNQTLAYDAIDRLKSATGAYGTVAASPTTATPTARPTARRAYTIPGTSNRMSKAGTSSITYISTGNIERHRQRPDTYYQTNQLATAKPSGTTSTYWYDAFGNRLKVVVRGDPFRIEIYDLNRHLLTQTSGSTIIETDYAYLDGMPIYAISPGTATYSALHTDNIGTVQRATNASKAVVWTGNYDPNGAVTPTASILMNLRQLGVLADASGDYHNGFRDRVPTTPTTIPGYLQSDPAGLVPWLLSPSRETPNTYPWLGYNPYNRIDPLGLANINLFPLASNQREAEDLWNPSDRFSVAGHGNSQFMADQNGKLLTPTQVALMIISDPNYYQGEPIELHSCSTGAGDNSFAQQLSNILLVPVTAPNDAMWSYVNTPTFLGMPTSADKYETTTIGPTQYQNTGRRVTFCPWGLCQ